MHALRCRTPTAPGAATAGSNKTRPARLAATSSTAQRSAIRPNPGADVKKARQHHAGKAFFHASMVPMVPMSSAGYGSKLPSASIRRTSPSLSSRTPASTLLMSPTTTHTSFAGAIVRAASALASTGVIAITLAVKVLK